MNPSFPEPAYITPSGSPHAMRVIYLLLALSCAALVITILQEFRVIGDLTEDLLLLFFFCVFCWPFISAFRRTFPRHSTRVFGYLVHVSLFAYLLLNVTDNIAALDAVPVLGAASELNNPIRDFLAILAATSGLVTLYAMVESLGRSCSRLALEAQNLQKEKDDRSRFETESRRALQTFRLLAEKMPATDGANFHASLAENLAHVLGVKSVVVGERIDPTQSRVRTRAFWVEDHLSDSMEFDVTGTVFEDPLDGQFIHLTRPPRDRFPGSERIGRWDIESFCGAPLLNREREVIGLLGILNDQKMDTDPCDLPTLRVFAARAAIELELEKSAKRSVVSEGSS